MGTNPKKEFSRVNCGHGAPNVDNACRATFLGSFRRAADLTPIPSELVTALQPLARAV